MDVDWQADLEHWLQPFLAGLSHPARRRMCPLYIAGLIGPGDRKSVQPMAARAGDVGYDQLHHFVAAGVWDSAPLEAALLKEADRLVGDEAGFLVIDEHSVTEEGTTFGWCRASIRFVAWQDVQLPVSGVGDPGLARSAGDGGPSALPVRHLDESSRADDAGASPEGSTGRSDKAGDRHRRDPSCHRLRRAFRLRACRRGLRVEQLFSSGFE